MTLVISPKLRSDVRKIMELRNSYAEIATKEFSDWGRKRGITVLSEYDIIEKFPRFKEIGRRPDNLIVIDDKFRKSFDISPHINYIALDYSLDPSLKKFIKKSKFRKSC